MAAACVSSLVRFAAIDLASMTGLPISMCMTAKFPSFSVALSSSLFGMGLRIRPSVLTSPLLLCVLS
jgi:hypothetical protein